MIRSELIESIAEKNRHLTQADVDLVVNWMKWRKTWHKVIVLRFGALVRHRAPMS